MLARLVLLAATVPLLGCGINNNCGEFNPFGCAKGDEAGLNETSVGSTAASSGGTTTGSSGEAPTTAGETGMDSSSGPEETSNFSSSTATTQSEDETTSSSSSGDASTTMPEPECGDGVPAGDEACDDGNMDPLDGCHGCKIARIAFLTSTAYTGNLGGLDGADGHCQERANASTKVQDLESRTFRAWLSSDVTDPSVAGEYSPATRFDTGFVGHYVRMDGETVASGWGDLKDSTLSAAIDLDESGDLVDEDAWTNTLPDGTSASMSHCLYWATTVGSSGIGDPVAVDGAWSLSGDGESCSVKYHLYCFEDVSS